MTRSFSASVPAEEAALSEASVRSLSEVWKLRQITAFIEA